MATTELKNLRKLGIGLTLMNGVLWVASPSIRWAVDSRLDRLDDPARPYICYGVQEALVYVDPWFAWGWMPLFYMAGLALIPWFCVPKSAISDDNASPHQPLSFVRWTKRLFLFFEAVFLLLLFVGMTMRGPMWGLYRPFETWDGRDATPHNTNLSQYAWDFLSQPLPQNVWLRETPGLALLIVYFATGIFVARRVSGGFATDESTGHTKRWTIWILAMQLTALLPVKMILRWTVSLRYFVELPNIFNV